MQRELDREVGLIVEDADDDEKMETLGNRERALDMQGPDEILRQGPPKY
jgi:hypothetical protein